MVGNAKSIMRFFNAFIDNVMYWHGELTKKLNKSNDEKRKRIF